MRLPLLLLLLAPLFGAPESQGLKRALALAEKALAAGDPAGAEPAVARAIERAPNSVDVWELRARWATLADDRDELVHALNRILELETAQGFEPKELAAAKERLAPVDPYFGELETLRGRFVERYEKLAAAYEHEERRHSAIRVHRAILALDPARTSSAEAVQRLASAPDPSLAAHAKAKDLLDGISEEWIAKFDAKHADWGDRAREKRDRYVTQTDAGYEVLIRTAEAMDQMNAFYREFFAYDQDSPRIEINVFKDRDTYLKRGYGPPVEWSGGHYTGTAVETYLPAGGGFQGMVGTLFHEAAHQFVSLATKASGWLNEGLASFFEGCRILPNGTVIMNLPAGSRLFGLARRMERGWMEDAREGVSGDKQVTPETAPSFRMVVESKYPWGPPWYGPTWGVVYFLYNYQDPIDGRYLYRKSFMDFVRDEALRMGSGAVKNFEEVVLANPEKPTRGVEFPGGKSGVALPETIDELNPVWAEWILALRDQELGTTPAEHPWADWARYAVQRGAVADAIEHYERALRADPTDASVRAAFAELLIDEGEERQVDRAVRLLHDAARLLDGDPERADELARVEKLLAKHDDHYESLTELDSELRTALRNVVRGYLGAELHLQAMQLARRFGAEFEDPEMFVFFEEALRREGRSPATWRLAYDEESLRGWSAAAGEIWKPQGEVLLADNGTYESEDFSYNYLTLLEVTSGDFSLEAEVQAVDEETSFAGIVFGTKSGSDFHSVLFLPRSGSDGRQVGFVDLVTFFGPETTTWRHMPVARGEQRYVGNRAWDRIRVDVTGAEVDVWWNGAFLTNCSFPSADVLSGSFGLLAGRGRSMFRNVRYQARDAGDVSARIERAMRMEGLDLGSGSGGSWIGAEPPFPQVNRWIQGERKGWKEVGVAPQLLVLWSINQNEKIPLDRWLNHLESKYAKYGLQILGVGEVWDVDELEGYLARHPFPGVVGADLFERQDVGRTFERYGVHGEARMFDLPRLILVDIDGKVAWEGDPGFRIGEPWAPGTTSYLDAPLDELIRRRRLEELRAWQDEWETVARPALERFEFGEAAPTLARSVDFDWRVSEDVLTAQRIVGSIRTAMDAIETTAQDLESTGHLPALVVLLDWGGALGIELDRKVERDVQKLTRGKVHTDWKKAHSRTRALQKKVGKGDLPLAELLDELATYEGAFPALLAERVAATGGEAKALAEVAAEGESLPARWLPGYLGW